MVKKFFKAIAGFFVYEVEIEEDIWYKFNRRYFEMIRRIFDFIFNFLNCSSEDEFSMCYDSECVKRY